MDSKLSMHGNSLGKVWQIWLLNSISDSKNIDKILEQARTSIKHLEAFENQIECANFIDSISSNDRIVFIIDEQFGQEVFSRFHEHCQIFAMYVYRISDKEFDQSCYKQFIKVR